MLIIDGIHSGAVGQVTQAYPAAMKLDILTKGHQHIKVTWSQAVKLDPTYLN